MQLGAQRRPRTIVLAAAALVLVAAWLWLAYTVVGFGMLSVRVQEADGLDLALHIPGAIVFVIMALVPGDALDDSCTDFTPVAPIVHAALGEISLCPDFTLMSVEDVDERIRVRKLGRSLLIEIEDGDTWVRVKLPLRAASYVASRLARAGRA